jgi:hypothetical protein
MRIGLSVRYVGRVTEFAECGLDDMIRALEAQPAHRGQTFTRIIWHLPQLYDHMLNFYVTKEIRHALPHHYRLGRHG